LKSIFLIKRHEAEIKKFEDFTTLLENGDKMIFKYKEFEAVIKELAKYIYAYDTTSEKQLQNFIGYLVSNDLNPKNAIKQEKTDKSDQANEEAQSYYNLIDLHNSKSNIKKKTLSIKLVPQEKINDKNYKNPIFYYDQAKLHPRSNSNTHDIRNGEVNNEPLKLHLFGSSLKKPIKLEKFNTISDEYNDSKNLLKRRVYNKSVNLSISIPKKYSPNVFFIRF